MVARSTGRRRRATDSAFKAETPGVSRIVTICSDFGTADGYVGAIKGVISSSAPNARLVDITHEIQPGDVRGGALALEAATPFFPAGTIHLAVVDPGVGTRRRAIAVEAAEAIFVGPDNGLLSLAAKGPRRVYVLDRAEQHRATVSPTFHGRDVFAPIVASLAEGARLRDLGSPASGMADLELPVASVSPREVSGEVIHSDRFGNLITNITTTDLRGLATDYGIARLSVTVGRRSVGCIVRTYGDAPRGTLLAVVGSSGRLEIAVREGSAAVLLRHRPGAGAVVRVAGLRGLSVLKRR